MKLVSVLRMWEWRMGEIVCGCPHPCMANAEVRVPIFTLHLLTTLRTYVCMIPPPSFLLTSVDSCTYSLFYSTWKQEAPIDTSFFPVPTQGFHLHGLVRHVTHPGMLFYSTSACCCTKYLVCSPSRVRRAWWKRVRAHRRRCQRIAPPEWERHCTTAPTPQHTFIPYTTTLSHSSPSWNIVWRSQHREKRQSSPTTRPHPIRDACHPHTSPGLRRYFLHNIKELGQLESSACAAYGRSACCARWVRA